MVFCEIAPLKWWKLGRMDRWTRAGRGLHWRLARPKAWLVVRSPQTESDVNHRKSPTSAQTWSFLLEINFGRKPREEFPPTGKCTVGPPNGCYAPISCSIPKHGNLRGFLLPCKPLLCCERSSFFSTCGNTWWCQIFLFCISPFLFLEDHITHSI